MVHIEVRAETTRLPTQTFRHAYTDTHARIHTFVTNYVAMCFNNVFSCKMKMFIIVKQENSFLHVIFKVPMDFRKQKFVHSINR